MIRHACCIVNPAAGRGRAEAAWERALPVLRDADIEVEAIRTMRRGHAGELAARAARDGWPAVIAVGGDGTVQEVASGLLEASDDTGDSAPGTVPLGIIPGGSGNDFIKPLGIDPDPEGAARLLLEAVARPVDAGRVEGRWFVNGVGMGLDARVAIEAMRPSPLRGRAVYVWAVLRALRSHRSVDVRVTVDGNEMASRAVAMVTVTNGPCHGGAFWLCPDARVDDGVLDVLIAHGLGRAGLLRFLARTRKAAHVGRPGATLVRGRRIVIESEDPLPVHADGEIVATAARRVAVELVPGRLTVLGREVADRGRGAYPGTSHRRSFDSPS